MEKSIPRLYWCNMEPSRGHRQIDRSGTHNWEATDGARWRIRQNVTEIMEDDRKPPHHNWELK